MSFQAGACCCVAREVPGEATQAEKHLAVSLWGGGGGSSQQVPLRFLFGGVPVQKGFLRGMYVKSFRKGS